MQCRVATSSNVSAQPVGGLYHATLHNIPEQRRSHNPTIDDVQSELFYLMTCVSSNQTLE